MDFNESNVINAIQQFYSTNEEDLRIQLNKYLTTAQSSTDAWRFAWNLLRYESSDPNNVTIVQYFGANCLYRKIADGRVEEFLEQFKNAYIGTGDLGGDDSSTEAADLFLRRSLLENCIARKSNIVRTKLASTLAAYIVYSTPDIWPEAFVELIQSWRIDQPLLLLNVLGSIPKESSEMLMAVDRKSSVRAILRTKESMVAELSSQLLGQHRRDAAIVDAAVRCVGAWVDFCNDAGEWVTIVGLCLQCAAEVGDSTLTAIAKFFCRFMENSELRKLDHFIGQLFDFLAPLFVRARSSNDQDELDDVSDMCVALLENHSSYALRHAERRESIPILIEAALNLTNSDGYYPADETSSAKLFTFWYNLYEDALSEDDSTTRESYLALIQPVYDRLADALFDKLRYPRDTVYAGWSAADKEQFEKYRTDGGDVLACCYRVLQSTPFLNSIVADKLSSALEKVDSGGDGWQESEMVLFALHSMVDYVSSEHEGLKTFFERDLIKIRFENSTIANTGLRMVAAYAHMIDDEHRLLKPALSELVVRFLNEPTTVEEATKALENLTKNGDLALAKDEQLCSTIFTAASSCFYDSRFKRAEQLRALSSVGYVLSIQSNDIIVRHLNEFLAPRLHRLQSVVEGKTTPCSKEDLLMEFDVLTTLIASLGSIKTRRSTDDAPPIIANATNPVYLITSQSFGLFENLYAASGGDKDVANKIIDTLKRALATLSDEAKDLLPQFGRILTLLFPPHANAIVLCKPLFLLFALDRSLSPTMVNLFNSLASKVPEFESDADTIEAFLGLCHQLVKKQWNFLANTENDLNLDEAVRVACRTIGNRSSDSPTVRQASQFFSALFVHTESPIVVQLVTKYGPSLMLVCFERLRVELLSSCVEFVADVILTLIMFNQQHTTGWNQHQHLASLTSSDPLIAAMLKEVGNKRKFREYAKQYNIACKKEARSAGV